MRRPACLVCLEAVGSLLACVCAVLSVAICAWVRLLLNVFAAPAFGLDMTHLDTLAVGPATDTQARSLGQLLIVSCLCVCC